MSALKKLVELDYDAIEAYDAAINRLDNPEYKEVFTVFKQDHQRHIDSISEFLRQCHIPPPTSPIYGMPILEVEKAKMVIVNKRSMKPGYAGIENQLFFQPKTSMLFGDGKKVLQDLVSEVKSL